MIAHGIDSMWVDNRTLAVDLLDSALWEVRGRRPLLDSS